MRTLSTERLELRPWADGDLAPFAALNADLHRLAGLDTMFWLK